MQPTEPKKFALLLGGETYSHLAQLVNVRNDLSSMRASLVGLDFDVRPDVVNPDLSAMLAAVSGFAEYVKANSSDGNAIALIFYGGHGFNYLDAGYIAPADLNPDAMLREVKAGKNVNQFAVSLDWVVRTLTASGARGPVLVVDACREKPPAIVDVERTEIADGSANVAPVSQTYGDLPKKQARFAFDTTISLHPQPLSDGWKAFMFFSTHAGRRSFAPIEIGSNSVFVSFLTEAIRDHAEEPIDNPIRVTTRKVVQATQGTSYFQEPDPAPNGSGGFPLKGTEKSLAPETNAWRDAIATDDVCSIEEFHVTYPVSRYYDAYVRWLEDHSGANRMACQPTSQSGDKRIFATRAVPIANSEVVEYEAQVGTTVRAYGTPLLKSKVFSAEDRDLQLGANVVLSHRGGVSEVATDRKPVFVSSNDIGFAPTATSDYWRGPRTHTQQGSWDRGIVVDRGCLKTSAPCDQLVRYADMARESGALLQIAAVMEDGDTDERGTPRQRAFAKAVDIQAKIKELGASPRTQIFVQPRALLPEWAGKVVVKFVPATNQQR